MINNIEIKNRLIRIEIDEIPEDFQVVLKDEMSDKELKGKQVDTHHVEFLIKSVGSSLGDFRLMSKKGQTYIPLSVDNAIFEEICLEDFSYDQEKDLYIRYFKSEEGGLNVGISKARDIPKKKKMQLKAVNSMTGSLELTVYREILSGVDDYRFLVLPTKERGMWFLEADYNEDTAVLHVDLMPIVNIAKQQKEPKQKWRMYIETVKKGEYAIYTMGAERLAEEKKSERNDYYDQRKAYLPEIYSYEYDGMKRSVFPYYTKKNNLALMQLWEDAKFSIMVMNRMKEIKFSKDGFILAMDIHDLEGYDLKGVLLNYRTQKHDEEEKLLFPVEIKKREGNKLDARCSIDFSKINIRPLYWDVYAVYEKDGHEYMTHFANNSSGFEKKYYRNFLGRTTKTLASGEIFYPYKTQNGNFAFQCRAKGEYDNIGFRLKERLAAFIYFILKPYWVNKNIYLVYEKFCVMAQDNGYYFFKYCMENGVEEKINRRIYYVMDPKSPDWEKVAQYKNHVIPFMSLKHMVYLIASKLLISTDTIDHVYAWRPKDSILHQYLDSKKLVFLQHGVIALKKVDFLYSSNKRGRCSIFITSNDMERDIIFDHFGYNMNQIAVTGLCRWDVLKDKSEGLREILIMPTWRNWLDEVSDETFRESDYYRNYMGFLNSNKLAEYLEKYDLKLNFYIHPKFREYIGNFKIQGERLRLIPFGEEPLNELMMRCKLLVTDYSSVCWDVFYQGKPVIFYHFDADYYEEAHGSYIDFEKDLFGDRVQTSDALFALLEEYAQNEFALKDQYAKMQSDCYKYIDNNNSQRICDEIVKRGW